MLSVGYLLFFAATIRVLFFLKTGISYGADSTFYLGAAEQIANGSLELFKTNPFYQFYPLLLSPLFLFNIDRALYIPFLHTVLSTLTVLLLYLSASRIMGKAHGIFVGLIASVYPLFFFYLPYVLSETPFLFSLSLLIFVFTFYLEKPSAKRLLGVALSCFLLLGSRPASVAILIPIISVVIWQKVRSYPLIFMGWLFVLGIALILLFQSPSLKEKVLRNPTVSGQLTLSVRHYSNNFEAYFRAIRDMDEFTLTQVPKGASLPERLELHSLGALKWIRENPGRYLGACLTRFFCFWFPGVLQGSWSWRHVLFDTFLALFLLGGAIGFLRAFPFKIQAWALVLMALSLALMSAFLTMDTDGRYRLPAELMLLILAPYPLYRFLLKKAQNPKLSRFLPLKIRDVN